MAGTVTFNLMHEGLLSSGLTGHMNVTLSRDGQAVTLGQNFLVKDSIAQSVERISDILLGQPFFKTKAKDGILSSRYESIRIVTSADFVSKSVVVDDATFDRLSGFFKEMEGKKTDYGLLYGLDCLDFAETVYTMTGAKGQIADLYSAGELEGSVLGWHLLNRKQEGAESLTTAKALDARSDFLAATIQAKPAIPDHAPSAFAGPDMLIPALLMIVVLSWAVRKQGKTPE